VEYIRVDTDAAPNEEGIPLRDRSREAAGFSARSPLDIPRPKARYSPQLRSSGLGRRS